MAIVSVKIPQLGEGLQEARLVELLKQPGDAVKKDEPIFVIETDKAISEIESPYVGTIASWVADVDAVLPIGAEIGTMNVADGVKEIKGHGDAAGPAAKPAASDPAPADSAQALAAQSNRPAHTAAGGKPIPPATRRLLREKGVAHLADQIPASGKRLLPQDVHAFLANQGAAGISSPGISQAGISQTAMAPTGNRSSGRTVSTADYDERPLAADQRTLNFRMARGMQVVLAAVLETDVDWTSIYAARQETRETGGPTSFAMLTWCIAQALSEHPRFRSSLSSDGETLRTYKHANLGIAVSRENDLLNTAVIRKADTLNRPAFFSEMKDRIEEARGGKDQIDATTTVTVSNIGTAGMRVGIPVVVTPAVATLAVGAVRDEPFPLDRGFEFRKTVSLTMSFDHRIVNGVGAANFLNTIRQKAAEFSMNG